MTLQEKLRNAAQKATPGQWKNFNDYPTGTFDVHLSTNELHCIVKWPGFDGVNGSKKQRAANARYIALVNPENILALLDRIDELEQLQHKHEAQLQQVAEAVRDVASVLSFEEIYDYSATMPRRKLAAHCADRLKKINTTAIITSIMASTEEAQDD